MFDKTPHNKRQNLFAKGLPDKVIQAVIFVL
jgi:hypothetical protein